MRAQNDLKEGELKKVDVFDKDKTLIITGISNKKELAETGIILINNEYNVKFIDE
jgi:hypothetical protein